MVYIISPDTTAVWEAIRVALMSRYLWYSQVEMFFMQWYILHRLYSPEKSWQGCYQQTMRCGRLTEWQQWWWSRGLAAAPTKPGASAALSSWHWYIWLLRNGHSLRYKFVTEDSSALSESSWLEFTKNCRKKNTQYRRSRKPQRRRRWSRRWCCWRQAQGHKP